MDEVNLALTTGIFIFTALNFIVLLIKEMDKK